MTRYASEVHHTVHVRCQAAGKLVIWRAHTQYT